jgi:hypothetical protein
MITIRLFKPALARGEKGRVQLLRVRDFLGGAGAAGSELRVGGRRVRARIPPALAIVPEEAKQLWWIKTKIKEENRVQRSGFATGGRSVAIGRKRETNLR